MFEVIGLAFATLLMIGIAILIGSLFAVTAWFVLRGRNSRRRRLIAAAFAFPIVCATYLWICVAVLPGESLFGDISEKLPNGYALSGLGKMPDFSYIEKEGTHYGNELALSCVERLQVVAYLVAGQYGQQCRATVANAPPDDKFFIFDTKQGVQRAFRPCLRRKRYSAGKHILWIVNPSRVVSTRPFGNVESTTL